MGTAIKKRIMDVYNANRKPNTPPFEKVAAVLVQQLREEQRQKEAKRKQELKKTKI